MTEKLKREIRKARPSLRLVSPMSFWFIFVMGVFNLILGASLFFTIDQGRVSAPLIIVKDFLTYQFWGVVFFVLGLVKLGTLKYNSWKWARRSLIFGVSLKSAWMVAFIIRVLTSPGTVFLSLLWITVALTQMLCYIFFLPPQEMRLFSGKKMDK